MNHTPEPWVSKECAFQPARDDSFAFYPKADPSRPFAFIRASFKTADEIQARLNALAGRNPAALAALEAACDNIRRQGDAGWPVPANSQAQDDLRAALAAFRGQA